MKWKQPGNGSTSVFRSAFHANLAVAATAFALLPLRLTYAKTLTSDEPARASLTADEQLVFDQTREFLNKGLGYAAIMGTRPETIGYGLADAPVGLAAWATLQLGKSQNSLQQSAEQRSGPCVEIR